MFWFVPTLPVIRLSAMQSSDNGTIGPSPPAFGHLGLLGYHGLHGHLGSRGVLGHRRPRTEDLAHQGTYRLQALEDTRTLGVGLVRAPSAKQCHIEGHSQREMEMPMGCRHRGVKSGSGWVV